MKNIPEKIFLQIGKDVEENSDFNELFKDAISWCEDRIYESDIEFKLVKNDNRKRKQTN